MIKSNAKCFQITHKTMALLIMKMTFKEVSLTLSVWPWENRMMKYINFHRAIQSNNTLFAGCNLMKVLSFWRQGFSIILFCKLQQKYLRLYLKNKSFKNFSLISFIWTLVLIFFFPCSWYWYREISVTFFGTSWLNCI